MGKNIIQQKEIINKSAKKGLVNAVYASGVFVILHFLYTLLTNIANIQWGDLFWFLIADIVLFIGAAIVSIPVGLLGGVFFGNSMQNGFLFKKLSNASVIVKGRILGAIASLILCVFMTIIFFRRGDMILLIYYYVSCIFTGSFFGGRTAQQINSEFFNSEMNKNL